MAPLRWFNRPCKPGAPLTRTRFPELFQRLLVAKETTQANIVRSIAHQGYRISRQFMSLIAKGERSVPPLQLARICEALKLEPNEQAELHRAAAIDHGYKLDCQSSQPQVKSTHASVI